MAFYDFYVNREYSALSTFLKKTVFRKIFNTVKKLTTLRDVLEVGAGKGYFGEICTRRDVKYLAIEANRITCEQLKEKGLNFINADVPPIPTDPEKYDLVFASHVIEHLNDAEDAYSLLKDMKRVLRKSGLICAVAPDYMKLGMIFWDSDYTHNFVTTQKRLEQLFYDAGLKIVTIKSFTGPFFGPLKYLINVFTGIYDAISQYIFHGLNNVKFLNKCRMTFVQSLLIIAKQETN